jgi:lysozyme family protein
MRRPPKGTKPSGDEIKGKNQMVPFERKLTARFEFHKLKAEGFTWEIMKPKYLAWLKDLKVTRFQEAEAVGNSIQRYLPIYQEIYKQTNVPVVWLAAVHYREASNNMHCYFGNGDPLNKRTIHVPKGRGPFSNFTLGCLDSLHQMGLVGLDDWTLDFYCYQAERFNGCGYHMHGLPSPYVFGGTSVQQRGKYTSDSRWNPRVMDTQLGVVPIYRSLVKINPVLALPLTGDIVSCVN